MIRHELCVCGHDKQLHKDSKDKDMEFECAFCTDCKGYELDIDDFNNYINHQIEHRQRQILEYSNYRIEVLKQNTTSKLGFREPDIENCRKEMPKRKESIKKFNDWVDGKTQTNPNKEQIEVESKQNIFDIIDNPDKEYVGVTKSKPIIKCKKPGQNGTYIYCDNQNDRVGPWCNECQLYNGEKIEVQEMKGEDIANRKKSQDVELKEVIQSYLKKGNCLYETDMEDMVVDILNIFKSQERVDGN